MNESNHTKEFVYKTTLGPEYGLTPSMIDQLGEPDEYVENPHYKSGPPANLYSVKRVEDWIAEHKEVVERARESRVKRSAAAKEVAEKKANKRRAEAMAWLDTNPITVDPLPADVVELASRHYPLGARFHPESSKALRAFVRIKRSNYESVRQEFREKHRSVVCDLDDVLRQRTDAVVEQAIVEWRKKYGQAYESNASRT